MTLPPFPVIDFTDPHDRWEWPLPSFIRALVVPPRDDVPQACELEVRPGTATHGELLSFEPQNRCIGFRLNADGRPVKVPFDRFCRLTLVTPLSPLPAPLGAKVRRMPAAEEERGYRAFTPQGTLTGRTLAHIESPLGLFLFPPVNEDRAVQRVFVPAGSLTRVEFGGTALDDAAERWIGTRQELEAALRRPPGRIPPVGEALVELGFITKAQLSAALREASSETPLGEHLVGQGILRRADLETALAYKMGYPIVDLTRFPIDPEARRRVSLTRALAYRALPLMTFDGGVVVAVDRLSRITPLAELQTYLEVRLIPVLALRKHLRLAAAGMLKDPWGGLVPGAVEAFRTTL